MKSPLSMTIDSTAAEPKTTVTASAAASASEKENDVVSAAIVLSLVTPPRPSSSASGDLRDEGTAKMDFERQAHHFPAANVPQKRAAASKKKAVPTKRTAKKRAAKAAPKAAPKKKHRKSNTQAEPTVASPPLVDLINIVDFLKMRLASFHDEMSAKDYRNFCLVVVEGCDTITTTDNKLSSGFSKYDQDSCTFLKKVQKKSTAFMEVVRNHCPPLHAILTILAPHLLCVFPLVLRGELRMHADKPTAYGIPGKVERWCIYFFDKIMKLQQKGNPDNYVVINCSDGDAFCMNDKGRGIDQFPGGVTVQHGCPKNLMKSAGSVASITIVIDVSFSNKDAKLKVLGQLFSWFASAVPSYSNLNSIQSLAAATTAVATQPSFLLDDIDPDGIVKDVIDTKAALLLSTCSRYECNKKAVKDTRLCTVCSNNNKECCVEDCKVPRRSPEPACFYCLYHRDPKTRCAKCKFHGLVEGSGTLCSTCNLLCRKSGCENQIAEGSRTLCSTCNLLCRKSGCENRLADGSKLCSDCNLLCRKSGCEREARKPEKETIVQENYWGLERKECIIIDCEEPRWCPNPKTKYCQKHRFITSRCRRCSVKALEGGAEIFCLDCKEKFRKEMEEALSLSLS